MTANPTFLTAGSHYDACHNRIHSDIAFWVRRAQASGGPVLELACGTCRVALAIAAAGIEVVGLDLSEPFLECARQKAIAHAVELELIRADIRDFRLRRVFPLVILPLKGANILLSHSDLVDCFGAVRDHLTCDGSFVLDAWATAEKTYSRESKQTAAYCDPNDGCEIHYVVSSEYDARTRTVRAEFQFDKQNGPYASGTLSLRHHSASELRQALQEAGLRVSKELHDYDGVTPDQPSTLVMCCERI